MMSSLDYVDEDIHLMNVNGVYKRGGPENYKINFVYFIQEIKDINMNYVIARIISRYILISYHISMTSYIRNYAH